MHNKMAMPHSVFFCVIVTLLLLLPATVSARPGQQECEPYCYETPTEVPPIVPTSTQSTSSGGSWSGYSDGRLNPAMDEFYSVYCANDQVEVWGGIPSPRVVELISLRQIIDMTELFITPSGITVARSGDGVLLSGNNGNGPSFPGTKWFSLSECIARNGGAPPPAPPPPPQPPAPIDQQPANPLPTPTLTPDPAGDAVADVNLCLPGSASVADFVKCLNFFAPDMTPFEYIYMIYWAVLTFCSGGFGPFALIGFVPAWRFWRRRAKRG